MGPRLSPPGQPRRHRRAAGRTVAAAGGPRRAGGRTATTACPTRCRSPGLCEGEPPSARSARVRPGTAPATKHATAEAAVAQRRAWVTDSQQDDASDIHAGHDGGVEQERSPVLTTGCPENAMVVQQWR